MRMIIAIFALVGSACASSPRNNRDVLSYTTIRKFSVGKTTAQEVIEALGVPSSQTEKNGQTLFQYNEPRTGTQRLTIAFFSNSKKIDSILWIPRSGENELSFEHAQAGFPEAHFREIADKHKSPHVVSKGASSFIDESKGVTIRYDYETKTVDGIAIYSPMNGRAPAENR